MIGMTEVFEMLDRWAETTGHHHGESIEWEEIDELWRETQDLLTAIVSPENEAERSNAFGAIREGCAKGFFGPKQQTKLFSELEKLEEATSIKGKN